ncbi:MAG TPA: hypothetical protein VMS56_12555 [Thermoanaerobaculia bacterium]|nr:hypothetical protein [Thermoanaerobaculia bacterium]
MLFLASSLLTASCREEGVREEELTTILLPVLLGSEPLEAGGRSWTTMTIATWPGSDTLWVGMAGKPVAIVTGVSRPQEFRRNELSGALVILPLRAAGELKIDHFLRDGPSGAIVPLPVVRSDLAEEGPAVIEAELHADASETLRIYDLVTIADGRVRVRIEAGGGAPLERQIELVNVGERGVHFAELPLDELVPAGAEARIVVEPENPAMRVWAMLVQVNAEGDIAVHGST